MDINKRRAASPTCYAQYQPKRQKVRRRSVSGGSENYDPQAVIALKQVGSTEFKFGMMKSVSWAPRGICYSLDAFLVTAAVKISKTLDAVRKTPPNSLKVYLDVLITYCNVQNQTEVFEAALRTKIRYIFAGSDLQECVLQLTEQVKDRNANWIRNKSGAVIRSVNKATLHYGKFNALRGATFVELPESIKRKKAVVNVKNTDNRCFGYAILAYKYEKQAYEKNRADPKQYDKYFSRERLDNLDYPVKIGDLEMLERELNLPINVVSFYDDRGVGMYSVYHTKLDGDDAVNLLYWKGHYAWIRSFERLMSGVTKHKARKYFCMRCLCHFSSPEVLDTHKEICTGDSCKQIMTMVPEGTTLKFRNTKYQQMCPFVVYADFECLPRKYLNATTTTKTDNYDLSNFCFTKAYQKHD
jgi:hypothetical protein